MGHFGQDGRVRGFDALQFHRRGPVPAFLGIVAAGHDDQVRFARRPLRPQGNDHGPYLVAPGPGQVALEKQPGHGDVQPGHAKHPAAVRAQGQGHGGHDLPGRGVGHDVPGDAGLGRGVLVPRPPPGIVVHGIAAVPGIGAVQARGQAHVAELHEAFVVGEKRAVKGGQAGHGPHFRQGGLLGQSRGEMEDHVVVTGVDVGPADGGEDGVGDGTGVEIGVHGHERRRGRGALHVEELLGGVDGERQGGFQQIQGVGAVLAEHLGGLDQLPGGVGFKGLGRAPGQLAAQFAGSGPGIQPQGAQGDDDHRQQEAQQLGPYAHGRSGNRFWNRPRA